jgi:hypothetical protein
MIRRFDLRDLPAPRRGFVMLKLVLVMGLMICAVALVVDIGLLIQRQQQLKSATDSAALAGVAAFVDGSSRPFPGSGDSLNALAAAFDVTGPATPASCLALVQYEADRFARANPVGLYVLKLISQPSDGTVTLGWVEHAHVGPDYLFQPFPSGPFNAVRVHTQLPPAGWLSPAVVLSQLVGSSQLALRSTSVAVFDQRLIGLRPVGTTKVPMLPVLIVCQPGQRTGSPWTNFGKTIESEEGDEGTATDDPDEGALGVCPGFAPPAQIVQVTLGGTPTSAGQGGPNGSLPPGPLSGLILGFGDDGSLETFEEQIAAGLGMNDLVEFGGMLTAGGIAGLTVPVRNDVLPAQSQAVATALGALIGQTRILALGEVGTGSAEILDFVAATVIDVQLVGSQIQLWLRPTRLHTATAVVMEGALRNPWIGKIVLVR